LKTFWLTSLGSSQDIVNGLMSKIKTYGLKVNGQFWKDNLKQMAWMAAKEDLADSKVSFWAILGSEEELLSPDLRYGLSLLAIITQAKRGFNFPIVILQTHGTLISSDQLPTPLKGADILLLSDSGLAAKLVAKAHQTSQLILHEYFIDIHGDAHIGQWFETRPFNSNWLGAMFGVYGGEIAFHGVGPSGELPSKSTLNYPMKGLRLDLKGKEYFAWAVKNKLDDETSYFVKIDGFPESILFGPFPTEGEDETDVHVIELK
jgi:hypothetical protein